MVRAHHASGTVIFISGKAVNSTSHVCAKPVHWSTTHFTQFVRAVLADLRSGSSGTTLTDVRETLLGCHGRVEVVWEDSGLSRKAMGDDYNSAVAMLTGVGKVHTDFVLSLL